MASYLVPIADTLEKKVFIKRFEANSINACENKIMNYVQEEWDWDDDFDAPDEYNSFKNYVKDFDILIGNITDVDII